MPGAESLFGGVDVAANVAITAPLPAGSNDIGDVGVLSIPPLPANVGVNVGEVDARIVRSLPGSRTNSIQHSEALDNTATSWDPPYNGTYTPDVTAGPNGRDTAGRFTDNATNDSHGMYTKGGSVTFTPGRDFCIGIDVKKETLEWVGIDAYTNTDSATVWFDLVNGVVGSVVTEPSHEELYVRDAWIEKRPNGYYRCIVAFGSTAALDATSHGIYFPVAESDPGVGGWYATYVGTGKSLIITGAQFEDNVTFPGPYLLTDGSTVTEGSDALGNVGVTSLPAIPAGENHVGQVGGSVYATEAVIIPTLVQYDPGDALGGVQSFLDAMRINFGSATLKSIVAIDTQGKNAALSLLFFNATFTGGTDNATYNIDTNDLAKPLGIINIAATDWDDIGDEHMATLKNLDLGIKSNNASKTIFMQVIIRTTATWTGTPQVRIKCLFEQD